MADFVNDQVNVKTLCQSKGKQQEQQEQQVQKPKKVEEVQEKKEVHQIEEVSLLVVGVSGGSPYDTSEFANTSKNFLYKKLNYNNIPELYKLMKIPGYDKKCGEAKYNNYKDIIRYFSTPNSKIFFDFKCSSECNSGSHFCCKETTLIIQKFIKFILKKGVNVVVGDHSMGALFNNWSVEHLGPCPIKVTGTTMGAFRMWGNKDDFLKSVHPTLNQLGDLSNSELVQVDFTNMSGTLVFSINDECKDIVKVISYGYKINENEIHKKNFKQDNQARIDFTKDKIPVHCEFKLFNGYIIVSSTHWCNLTEVNSDIDENKLKSQYIETFGTNEIDEFEREIAVAKSSGQKEVVQQVYSVRIKEICSGIQSKNSK